MVACNDSLSRKRTVSTIPSEIFNATLPTKPSHTSTSALPLYRSRPSTLPTKFMGSSLINLYASRVSSLPLLSSSPMESSPTRGLSALGNLLAKIVRKYTSPMMANCCKFCGLESTFAPTSIRMVAVPWAVGKTAASAGRSTPGMAPKTIFAVAIAAPVLPAVTKPAALPSRTRRSPTRRDESRLDRTACAAFACIDDADCQLAPETVQVKFATDDLFFPHQHDFHVVVPCCEDRPFYFWFG